MGVQFLLVYLSKKVASLAILHWNCSFSKIIGCIRGHSQRCPSRGGGGGGWGLENQEKLGHRGGGGEEGLAIWMSEFKKKSKTNLFLLLFLTLFPIVKSAF